MPRCADSIICRRFSLIVSPQLRQWLAIGSGIGIEFDGDDLLLTAVRVRFRRICLLGEHRILNYAARPAAEWGQEYAAFARRYELTHLAAYVLLPRETTTVRLLSLPPIKSREMEAAIRFQSESLHPHAEEDAAYAWARLEHSGDVLVAITRRETVEHLTTLFAEAGVQIASFTVSAAAIYSAVRLLGAPAHAEFAAVETGAGGIEIYGESQSRAVFSAFVDGPAFRMETFARSELRLPPAQEFVPLRSLLPVPEALDPLGFQSSRCYAAALCAALPWLAVQLNLLPKELRDTNSRLFFVPTAVLAGVLLICAVALAAENSWAQRQYLAQLNVQIAQLQPKAQRAQDLERRRQKAILQTQQIDAFRARSKADLDAINELTRLVAPPSYLSGLDMNRSNVQFYGVAPSATGLLNALDGSPKFKNSSFMTAISRNGEGEVFRVRADRQGTP